MIKRVRSQLGHDLSTALEGVKSQSEETAKIAISETNDVDMLAVLEDTSLNLTERQRYYYVYHVHPQLHNIYKLVSSGATMAMITESLGIPIAALYAIRKAIPQVEEMFTLGRMGKAEIAMESIYHLAQERVTEEEVIDKFGEIHVLQKVVQPSFQAAKYIVEREGPSLYRKEDDAEIKIGVTDDLKKLLQEMTPEALKRALDKTEEVIVDAEFTERE